MAPVVRGRDGDRIMIHTKLYIQLFLLFSSIFLTGEAYCLAEDHKNMFIKCEFDKSDIFCRECVNATVWLYTTNGEIAYVKELVPPILKNGSFAYISPLPESVPLRRETIKGVEYLALPISSFLFSINEDGKYHMMGGEYEIAVNVPVINNDSFFGRLYGVETQSQTIRMTPVDFKIKPLPKVKENTTFSGAVGEFEVKTIVPRGDIIVNEEASVYVVVKGNGILGSDILPEYKEAFGKGNKLKSFSESNDMYFDRGRIMSELELECEFVPTDINDCEIGVIRFGYFNPRTRRYEVAESEPIRIDVKSSVTKIKPFDI